MEKYKRFADKGTGVNPFTPIPPKPAAGLLPTVGRYIIGPLLVLFRAALILVLLPVYTLLACLLPWLTGPIWPLSRLLARTFSLLLGRLLLLVLGVYRIPHVPFPFYALPRNSFAYTPQHPGAHNDGSAPHPTKPQQPSSSSSRDLVIATHASYLDVLYFATFYAPVFAVPTGNGRAVIRGPLAAFWGASGALDSPVAPADTVCLSEAIDAARRRRQPVVLLAEGTTTNGRAVLEFDSATFDSLTEPQRTSLAVELVLCQYPAQHFSPTFPVGSAFSHFLALCCQFYNPLTVKYVRASEIPAIPSSGPCDQWCSNVRSKLAAAGAIALVSLSASEKAQFRLHWEATQGSYKKAL